MVLSRYKWGINKMAENNDKPSSKIKEYADQLKLALESVPSEEVAKELIMDKIQDAYLIKIKVSIENKLGLIMILVSRYNKKILTVYSLAGTARTLNKTNPYEECKRIIQDLLDISTEEGLVPGLSESLGRAVYYSLPEKTILELQAVWEKKEIQSTLDILKMTIIKLMNIATITLEGDIEEISSIKVRFNNPLDGKVKPIAPPQEDIPVEVQPASNPISSSKKPFEVYLDSIISNYKKVVNVKTTISPSDGVEFENLINDEVIYFKPSMKTEEDKQLLQQLGLILPGGKIQNIEGRFLKLIEGEFDHHIFAVGPENLLLHSVDTNRVKVQVKNKRTQKIPVIDGKKKEPGIDMTYIIAGVIIVGVLFFLLLR
jgi:hypothetical protein